MSGAWFQQKMGKLGAVSDSERTNANLELLAMVEAAHDPALRAGWGRHRTPGTAMTALSCGPFGLRRKREV